MWLLSALVDNFGWIRQQHRGNAAGLPLGMMFAARFGDEATLFRLAAQLEQERPWKNKLPPVCA